jgi:hypothetical protein
MKHTDATRAISRALITTIAASALVITSTWTHAQTQPDPGQHPLTRAEVMHELEELEAAGYNPSLGDDSHYPDDIQEAERKVAAMHAAEKSALIDKQPDVQAMPTPMQ